MSRIRIVKGNITKIVGGDYKRYSSDDIENIGSKVIQKGKDGVIYNINEEPPKPPMLNYPDPVLNGDVIFCNGYLSSPKKNPGSYLNVIMNKVPDDVKQNPLRGANMSEKKITDVADIMTNDELEFIDRQGGGTLYSDKNYKDTEYFRWMFSAKEQFEGYWEGYDNVSKKRYSQIFKEYFHAQGNAHFINGSHGLQSSGAHRVEHGIAQGYSWARQKWNIKEKKEIEKLKEKNPGALSYSPQYKPVTVVGHSQGAAIAAGVALGIIYYAYEMGWEEIPINILFLGTHQPQGLYGKDYESFKSYYFEDFINEWVLEWLADIFTNEKLYQNKGIYEKMNELLGDNSWGGLINRAVQFTFPNDRALFVTRMGDIPYVKNACNEKDNLYIESWGYHGGGLSDGFFLDDGYQFPKRLLDKVFNDDGSPNEKAPTFRQRVKEYWKVYQEYAQYRSIVKANPSKKYAPAEYAIPKIDSILPSWFKNIMMNAIAKAEGTKQKAYMQSELYRKKLNALLAFAKVHEMELQAHFAPVGLMFNKGVLSDWEEYQDQTIWDRIQDTGKDIFYKVNYSAGSTNEQKKKEEKAFVEGEGKSRMVKTSIANTPGIKEWVDKAKEELKVEKHWYSNILEWWKGDKEYDGSGWGHGARQSFAKAIGLDDGEVNSLFEAGIYSMLQTGEVDISNSPRLIRKINNDIAFIEYEKDIMKLIINDQKYKKESFKTKEIVKGIQLGGKRTEGEMLNQFKYFFSTKYLDTWKVAANELTWLLRSIGVTSIANVDINGNITISHKFEDTFDLRPSGDGSRSIEYDTVSIIAGFLYHDIAGGNDLMKVKGKWSNTYTIKQLQDRLNEKPKGFMEDLGDNLKYDVQELKNNVHDNLKGVKNKIKDIIK
ncbi:hypothetical protein BBI01_22050 [Chryseobacterium artocarpi]|uniref:Uncharacterized protein n=1 Tax=Chryseobacterium artocarpi TaxID=1414727 RepID=A0A1B8ZYL7_9FLAO|nr:hypothetical protein [Chryseobacterium artocarpi]OCA76698.1 hypothetical protein BBI01_22050 [Chryseobacterium artocarpi]